MIRRLLILLLMPQVLCSQVIYTASDSTGATTGKVSVGGYADAYYTWNFNEPDPADQPYFVSSARHNEVNINLAFVELKYTSPRVRARFTPGFGTYVNSNYARETGTLKNLIEANAGFCLFPSRQIWADVGVFGSHYTNEGPISKDHLAYTRSFSAENVPYYLAGVKLTIPFSDKINGYFYLLNGWQQINDENSGKSLGTQLEYKASRSLTVNWNTYTGKERVAADGSSGIRYFSDIYFVYNRDRVSVTSCLYYGLQKNDAKDYRWWQANLIGRYAFTPVVSATARVEYFSDPDGVLIIPVTEAEQFSTLGLSAGVNLKLEENLLFRVEARQLTSKDKVFSDHGNPAKTSLALTGSLCVWF